MYTSWQGSQMIDSYIVNYIVLFALLEIYEVQWQKAQTLMGMLARMHQHYRKNIFLFLLMQPTFYFGVGFAMLTNYNTYALILLFLKTADIVTKMLLIQRVFIKRELSQELTLMLLAPLKEYYLYIGIIVYSGLIYLSFC